MNHQSVSRQLEMFVRQYCDSVALIDVLLLLFQRPERNWKSGDIQRELRSSASSVEMQLEKLVFMKFVVMTMVDGTKQYHYSASSADNDALIGELARQYSSHKSKIIELIYERRPATAINAFSDVFRFRKD